MCEINWLLLLEYLKAILSGPPMALAIAVLITWKFRQPIEGVLARAVRGKLFGGEFELAPPPQGSPPEVSPLQARANATPPSPAPAPSIVVPPELMNDPNAHKAIAYVQANPASTVFEYKRLYVDYQSERLFNAIYGSQIDLLCFLEARGNQPATLADLLPFHKLHQERSASTDYQLSAYVGFLVSFGVLTVSGPSEQQTYSINDYGLGFLSYIRSKYPAHWNKRTF